MLYHLWKQYILRTLFLSCGATSRVVWKLDKISIWTTKEDPVQAHYKLPPPLGWTWLYLTFCRIDCYVPNKLVSPRLCLAHITTISFSLIWETKKIQRARERESCCIPFLSREYYFPVARDVEIISDQLIANAVYCTSRRKSKWKVRTQSTMSERWRLIPYLASNLYS